MSDNNETQDAVRYDDLLRAALTTVAGGQYQSTQVGLRESRCLTRDGYENLSRAYDNDGLFSTVIDRAAEDAMSAGFLFHADTKPAVREEFARLEIADVFTDALRFTRLHGGAVIVPVFQGLSNFASSLGRTKNKTIDYFEVISIDRLTVDSYGSDGMPQVYNVESLLQSNAGQFKLHASRCIYVMGRKRPYRQTDTELIWPGVAEGQRCMQEVMRLSRSLKWAEKALERKQQGVFKMKGLAQALHLNQGTLVTQRLNLVDAVRSILNTIAIDEGDDYEVNDTNLSSISDTLDSQMQAVSAVTGYPITVLFGRRTTSLNSKGDSDTDTYYRMLNKLRTSVLMKPLNRIVELMGEYLDTGVPDGKPLVEIAKLEALSEYEESEIELRRAQAIKARVEAVMLMSGTEPEPTANAKPPATGSNAVAAAPPAAKKKPAILTPEELRKIVLNEELAQ